MGRGRCLITWNLETLEREGLFVLENSTCFFELKWKLCFFPRIFVILTLNLLGPWQKELNSYRFTVKPKKNETKRDRPQGEVNLTEIVPIEIEQRSTDISANRTSRSDLLMGKWVRVIFGNVW